MDQDPLKIVNGNWEFKFVERDWISKSIPFKHKIIHNETAPYHVIDQLEEKYQKHFQTQLEMGLKEIAKYLNVN